MERRDKKKDPTAPSRATPPQETVELLELLGRSLSNMALYGPDHRITSDSIQQAIKALPAAFKNRKRLRLGLAEERLTIDGQPLESAGGFLEAIRRRLVKLDLTEVTLLAGMSGDELRRLLRMLSSDAAALQDKDRHGLKHVETSDAVYRRMARDEVVVDRRQVKQDKPDGGDDDVADFLKKLKAADSSGAGRSPGPEAAENTDSASGPADGKTGPGGGTVSQIMAFLKGEAPASGELRRHLREQATDADRLAELITEATAVRQRNRAVSSGETLADIVIGCLRRTYDGLRDQPDDSDQPLDMEQTMLVLEKNVLDRLHHIMEDVSEEDRRRIHQSIEDLNYETDINRLTVDYMRRRKAFKDAEKRMLEYINADGEGFENAPGRAAEQLGDEGWQELVAKSSAEDGGGSGGGLPGSINALAALLSELSSMMDAGVPDRKSAQGLARNVGHQVHQLAESTQEKIADLGIRVLEAEGASPDTRQASNGETAAAGQQHADTFELLAEIVQELCQPAAAINCSVNMIAQGYMGAVNREQRDMLDVAADCGERLGSLLQMLRNMVGVPSGLEPQNRT